MKKLQKRISRRLALWIIPPLGTFLIRLIYLTCKKRFHITQPIGSEPVIFAFWHGDLLFQPYLYYQLRSTPKAKVIISEHFDGQIIARIMKFFRLDTLHGSSSRGGAKVLIQGIRAINEGYDIGITPDGPKGPRHEVADGVVVMAQKAGVKVVVYSCVPSRYWQLRSWDRFSIAKPFSTLDFYTSRILDLDEMSLEDAKAVVKEELMRHAF
jgi:lysophospholipid acyltransferase (LPLAT)-like uncharacterized protein